MHLLLCLLYFNPRSHERSDGNCYTLTSNSGISIHAPTRGATGSQRITRAASNISIHAPTRGATADTRACAAFRSISIHAPTRGATIIGGHQRYNVIFQSTLPREERQERGLDFFEVLRISIHAPTRGATVQSAQGRRDQLHFNPRSHERSDQADRIMHDLYEISIHAPTRGATFAGGYAQMSDGISIHAPTRGATGSWSSPEAWRVFQSTLPREERPGRHRPEGEPRNFNPRSHERSDDKSRPLPAQEAISIHAPTRGATRSLRSHRAAS